MSSEACARHPARQELLLLTQRRAPRSGEGAGRTPGAPRSAALPRLHRSRGDPVPPEARASSLPQCRVCSRCCPSGRSRAGPHLCAFSRAVRGERWRPRSASPRQPLQRWRPAPLSGMPGGGRFALLLIHEGAAKARDWAEVRCARPGSTGTDTRCGRPTPLGAHFPASAPALGTEPPGRVLLGAGRLRLPETPCPEVLLLSLGFCHSFLSVPTEKRPGNVFSRRLNFSGPWLEQGAQVGGCKMLLVETNDELCP